MKKFMSLLFLLLMCAGKGPMPLPRFKIIDLQSNETLTLASLKGKVALFNFWAMDAKGEAQQDALSQIHQRYPKRVVVVSVCITKENKQKVKAMIKEKGWTHIIAKASRGFKYLSFSRRMPYTFVVDSTGLIQSLDMTAQDYDSLEKEIKPLLQQQVDIPVKSSVLPDQKSAETVSGAKPHITLYGSPQCRDAQAMLSHLEYESLPYKELNVNKDRTAHKDMLTKLKAAGMKTSQVELPVMEVNGHIMMNPSFEKVKQALKKSVKRTVKVLKDEKIPQKVDIPVKPSVLPDQNSTKTVSGAKPHIILYGSPTCGRCKAMRSHLENESLPYKDLNVNEDRAANHDMWTKLRTAGMNTSKVGLPVMEVNGHIMVNPSFEKVKQALKKPVKRTVKLLKKKKTHLDKVKVEIGEAFVDKASRPGYLLVGFQVMYGKKYIYKIHPIYSKILNEKDIESRGRLSRKSYGGNYGKFERLEKPGYTIVGLRYCEQIVHGQLVIKHLAVVWKKWGDDNAKLEMSKYLGSDSDEGKCIEIMAPEGQRAIGIYGNYKHGLIINRLSLLFADIKKK